MEEHAISNNGPIANFEMRKDCHGNGRDVECLQEILGLEPRKRINTPCANSILYKISK